MNTEENKILSKECKETVINFFILKTHSSRKSFENLLLNKDEYKNKKWDSNVSIVNYLLAHKEFNPSKSNLNSLYKMTNEWSIVDENGENSLFLLMKKEYNIKDIINLSDEFNIECTKKNYNGLYFINYFLKQTHVNHIVQQAYDGINKFPEIRLSKYFKQYIEILLFFPILFKETIKIEMDKFEEIKKLIMTDKFKNFNKNQLGISLESEIVKVEKILHYLFLENQLKEKFIKEKKIKI